MEGGSILIFRAVNWVDHSNEKDRVWILLDQWDWSDPILVEMVYPQVGLNNEGMEHEDTLPKFYEIVVLFV
jgi:hypothetical protein